ncbi:MAG: transposase [Firmicutes bacterium]|nr:transposase [Bacillota bacterium]
MKSLLSDAFNEFFAKAKEAFPQERTAARAWWLAVGMIVGWGRRTIGGAIRSCLQQFEDWSAKYRVFSRSPWEARELFQPALDYCLGLGPKEAPFVVGLDDTSVKKTGKHIPKTSYLRDPMSPPFHVNLRWGQRFLQASALIRPEGLHGPARAIPIRFEPAPPPKKPGKRAKPEEIEAYRRALKTENLSVKGVQTMEELRGRIPRERGLLCVVDGSFCNGHVFKHLPAGVEIVARARKDIRLYTPAEETLPHVGRKRLYGEELPTPEEIRRDQKVPWQTACVYGAGKIHQVRYKSLAPVLWRKGAGTKPLRLIVVAPLRYRPRKGAKLSYRDPAYLLTTDLRSPIDLVLQAAFDRWEIEVNHREEKSLMGVGQAQVRSVKSVGRVPQFVVAIYSFLLLASLKAFGPKRTDDYPPLPKWRKAEAVRRPSISDIVARFRQEMMVSVMEEPTFMRKNVRQKLASRRKTGHGTTDKKSILNPVLAAFQTAPYG